jgi:hypothetical protein
VLYRRQRVRTITLALCVGLAIVVSAVITSAALTLEPLYFCVLVCMFVASRIVSMFGAKVAQTPPQPLLPQPSDMEVVEMLRKRGYDKLVKKKRKTR